MIDLNAILLKHKVFVDTSSWMFPPSEAFFHGPMEQALRSTGQKLVLPGKVLEEVKKFLNHEDQEKRTRSRTAASILQKYIDEGLVQVFGSQNDPFTDQTILYVFQQFRVRYQLALITQDKGLATDVYNLNHQRAVSGQPIRVFRVNMHGQLSEWRFDDGSGTQAAPAAAPRHGRHREARQGDDAGQSPHVKKPHAELGVDDEQTAEDDKPIIRFRLGTHVESGGNELMSCRHLPGEGDAVISARYGQVRLGEPIGRGGEGDIYRTDTGLVCKIYKKEKLTHARCEKLKLMLTVPVERKGICWPRDIVTNQYGEFVGYLMDAAEGKPMQTCLFAKPVLLKNFPDWTRANLVKLCHTMLSQIEYLHERNIIIGDINPMNILIKNDREVYFVDTDSYQIENYPCPVGTVNFTAPEIQGKNFGTFLRTFEHEYFAVATLIFMTLLPGKPPYSQQGGGTPEDNIRKMDFPYPFGDDSTGKAPDGPWRFIWSHLTYKVKEALYKTFKENERVSVSELKFLIQQYHYSIVKQWSSDELFPMSHKIPEGKAVMMTCSKCGQEKQVHINHKQKLEQAGKPFICEECFQRNRLQRLQRMQAAAAGTTAAYPGNAQPKLGGTTQAGTRPRTGGSTGPTTNARPAGPTGTKGPWGPTGPTGTGATVRKPNAGPRTPPQAGTRPQVSPGSGAQKAQPARKKSLLDRLIDFLSNI